MTSNISEIHLGIDFTDSKLILYNRFRGRNAITVNILLLNAKIAKITFADPILFVFRASGDLTMFCQQQTLSQLHREALNRAYDEIPEDQPYKIYQFLDLDDKPTIEIMCTEYKHEICDAAHESESEGLATC